MIHVIERFESSARRSHWAPQLYDYTPPSPDVHSCHNNNAPKTTNNEHRSNGDVTHGVNIPPVGPHSTSRSIIWRHPHRQRSSCSCDNTTTTSSATNVHLTHQLNSYPRFVSSTISLGLGLNCWEKPTTQARHHTHVLLFCILHYLVVLVCLRSCCCQFLE